jgi:hypothetical protein
MNYYNEARMHLSLNKDSPLSRTVERAGRILCRPILGGLHHNISGFDLRQAQVLCRRLELFSDASVAIDGSKFKAFKTRDRNFTQAKMQPRLAQIDESIARYLSQLDSADRQGETVPEAKITRLKEKIATLRQEIQRLNTLNTQMMQTEPEGGARCVSSARRDLCGLRLASALNSVA